MICIEERLIGGRKFNLNSIVNLIDTNNFMIFMLKIFNQNRIKKKLEKRSKLKSIVDKIKKRLKINGNKIGIDFDNTIVNYDNSFYQKIKEKIYYQYKKTQK